MPTNGRNESRRTDARPPIAPVGATSATWSWTSLSGFQRDLLLAITLLEGGRKPPSGTRIIDYLSSRYEERINRGRLYQNLDELVEAGLVEKSFIDGRTNAYLLTDDAERLLREATQTLEHTCGVQLER